jgi:hypothetical protein
MRIALAGLLMLHTLACARVEASRQPVEVEMSNVDLHVTADVTVHIRHLRGRFVPAGSRQTPYLDDKNSYSVTVDTGEVAIDLESLNALMRRTMVVGRANVDNLRLTIDDQGKLRQKGRIDKAIDIPMLTLAIRSTFQSSTGTTSWSPAIRRTPTAGG